MRVLLKAVVSLIAFMAVFTAGLNSSGSTTTHIGTRIPPEGAGCFQSGTVETDAGKVLKVFQCPA